MHQFSQGRHTTQGHKGIPEGHFEEEQGRKGFFGPVSHLIKPQPSTRWNNIEGPLKPKMFDPTKLEFKSGVWQRMLFNQDVTLSWYCQKAQTPNEAFRNADGDTLYFCHQGSGTVLTEFGLLKFAKGSYINLGKCLTHAFHCESDSIFLVIESHTSSFVEPDRGMVGKNAFYDPAAFQKPDLDLLYHSKNQNHIQIKKINVKRANQVTQFSYDECVFDTVGWKGDYWPFVLDAKDLMPLISARVHLPPSAHTTFVAKQFVVCTFLPRPLESDADALKVPFYHQNIDYDEVLFYHDGNFFSRDNLHAGMMSFHPAGFPHGPHPKAIKNIGGKTHTDEFAVMVDTWNHLHVDDLMTNTEVVTYWKSWMSK